MKPKKPDITAAASVSVTTDDKGPEVREAEGLLDEGITMLVAAFNLAGSRSWKFPPSTKERATSMLLDIFALFREGGFRPRTGPVLEGDADFQKFMQQAIGKR